MMEHKRRQTSMQGLLTSRKNFNVTQSFYEKLKKSTERSKKEKKQEYRGFCARKKKPSNRMFRGKFKV